MNWMTGITGTTRITVITMITGMAVMTRMTGTTETTTKGDLDYQNDWYELDDCDDWTAVMNGITVVTRMTEMQLQGAFVSEKQFFTQDSTCTHVACWCNQFMIFTTS